MDTNYDKFDYKICPMDSEPFKKFIQNPAIRDLFEIMNGITLDILKDVDANTIHSEKHVKHIEFMEGVIGAFNTLSKDCAKETAILKTLTEVITKHIGGFDLHVLEIDRT